MAALFVLGVEVTRPVITCASCGEKRTHKARGWCGGCYRRWTYYDRPEDGPPPLKKRAPCGTPQGWHKHKRDKTPPCDGCRTAHNAAERGHYKSRIKFGKERCYSEWTEEADWTQEQRRAAERAEDASTGPEDYRLLLEMLGLARATPSA